MRLPRDFAELLLALKSERRAVALWLALEDRIASVWDLPMLINSAADLRRVGLLLNLALRDVGQGRKDWVNLKMPVTMTLRTINRLRTHAAPAEAPDGTPVENSGKLAIENPANAQAVPKAAKQSLQSGDWVQIRVRLPLAFAKVLWAARCEKRAITFWATLEGRIGCVGDLPQLGKSAAELRRLGVLLIQALRYFDERGEDGEEWVELKAEVTNILREIKKLRPPNIPAEKSEAKTVVKAWENARIKALIKALIDVMINVLKTVGKGGWKIPGEVAGKNVGGRTKRSAVESPKKKD
jgi:hypothetical protein